MAAENVTAEELLNYLPLTDAVTQVVADLPKPLPPVFYNQTKQVPGDSFRRFLLTPTRRVAKRAVRGSPPRRVEQTTIKVQDAKFIHSIEEIEAGAEVYKLFHPYTAYEPIVYHAENELDRRAQDFARRSLNLRTAAIHSVIATGFIWFDANDDLLPSSAGHVEEIDFGVPLSNRRVSSVDWSDPNADVVTFITNEMNYMTINSGGHRPRYAIYGPNIPGYIARNTSFREYLKLYPAFNAQFVQSGRIADDVLELIWVPASLAYFERPDGTLTQQFPPDQITFFPEPTRDMWELKEGSQPVPKEFAWMNQGGDFRALFNQMFEDPAFGMFRYALGQVYPVPQIIMVQGDNFLPDLPTPRAVWFLDVKP